MSPEWINPLNRRIQDRGVLGMIKNALGNIVAVVGPADSNTDVAIIAATQEKQLRAIGGTVVDFHQITSSEVSHRSDPPAVPSQRAPRGGEDWD